MLKLKSCIILIAIVSIGLPSRAQEVPRRINHQGRLADNLGSPVDATVSMEFKITDMSLDQDTVTDEGIKLGELEPAPLQHDDVVNGSEVVTNLSGIIMYVITVDYNMDYLAGTLVRVTGSTIPDGATVRVDYAYNTDIQALWSETQSVTVDEGLFSVVLGSNTPIPASVFSARDRFLEVNVEGEFLSPRRPLDSVPYAMKAQTIADGAVGQDQLASNAVTADKIADDAVTSGEIDDGTIAGNDVGTDALGTTQIQDVYVLNTGDSMSGTLTINTGGLYAITATGQNAGVFESSTGTSSAVVAMMNRGIDASGDDMGGHFADSDGTSSAYAALGTQGVVGYGDGMGGYFADDNISPTGYANVGESNYGVRGYGNTAGGYFKDQNGTGHAYVGYGDKGIHGEGSEMGGLFEDSNGTSIAYAGYGDTGLSGYGTGKGGYFANAILFPTGYASVGEANYGIRAYGKEAGAYFADSDGTADGYIGYDGRGVAAAGTTFGGYFEDMNDAGRAYLAYGDTGVEATGTPAGHFAGSGFSEVTLCDLNSCGILAVGTSVAGRFWNGGLQAAADLAYNSDGIVAEGYSSGGEFTDLDSSAFANVARATYKITGTGSVNFIQNHPEDAKRVISYSAPEGDEVATYTRGTAKLVNGEATVALGDTFKWVTNPDIGLTVHLTPIGEPVTLCVTEKATDQIKVKAPSGSPDITFDYLVHGLRIGFEDVPIVQNKEREAYIPSMADHRDLLAENPDLVEYTAMHRHAKMSQQVEGRERTAQDLSASHALKEAIHEYDPEVDGPVVTNREPLR